MDSRKFNGIYRPLVKAAWLQYCDRSGTPPNNKQAYTLWYQQTLHEMSGGNLHSTKQANSKDQAFLISQFELLVAEQQIPITGMWTTAQKQRFHELAQAAHKASGTDLDFIPWTEQILAEHFEPIDGKWYMGNCTKSFDEIMSHLAIIAFDEYWIDRTAKQSEIRLRYQIKQFLKDLDSIDPTFKHDWAYICSIYKQSQMMPDSIDEAPAIMLWKVLQMLDTHIRRLCHDLGIRPMELPTRAHAKPGFHLISPDAKHFHIGHDLEHIPASRSKKRDTVPF